MLLLRCCRQALSHSLSLPPAPERLALVRLEESDMRAADNLPETTDELRKRRKEQGQRLHLSGCGCSGKQTALPLSFYLYLYPCPDCQKGRQAIPTQLVMTRLHNDLRT